VIIQFNSTSHHYFVGIELCTNIFTQKYTFHSINHLRVAWLLANGNEEWYNNTHMHQNWSNRIKTTASSLVLFAFLSIQAATAFEVCLCFGMVGSSVVSSGAKSELPTCHQEAPIDKNNSGQNHDHNSCDCSIDTPDDPQTLKVTPTFDFQKSAFCTIPEAIAQKKVTSFILFQSTALRAQHLPLYKLTGQYLI